MAANIPSAAAGETASTGTKPAQTKLPKHIVPLPEDVPEKTWKLWPRQVEAHLLWPQARERQITAKVKAGALPCYYCPDGSCRINREHMVALWGEPDAPAVNPLSAAGREARGDDGQRQPRRITDSDLDLDDPIVGMFREAREMLRASNDFNLQLIKALMAPITEQMKLLKELADMQADRVSFLETRQDSVMAEREALADFRHERDLEIAAAKSREDRRSKVMSLLNDQLPEMVKAWAGGKESLSDFVEDLSPELVEMVLQSGTLPAKRQAQLAEVAKRLAERRAAEAAKAEAAKAAAGQSNGAAASPPKQGEQAS